MKTIASIPRRCFGSGDLHVFTSGETVTWLGDGTTVEFTDNGTQNATYGFTDPDSMSILADYGDRGGLGILKMRRSRRGP